MHLGQRLARPRDELARVRRGGDGVHPEELADVGRRERQPAGDALEQDDAERVEVRAAVDRRLSMRDCSGAV